MVIRIVLLLSLCLAIGCAGLGDRPSVCDTTEKSLLCDLSAEYGVRIEDIGNGLIIANSVAIGEGLYTREQARAVLVDLRAILDNPVSYAFFRLQVLDRVAKYPELILVAQQYFDELTTGQIMYKADRQMLCAWLDDRIEALE